MAEVFLDSGGRHTGALALERMVCLKTSFAHLPNRSNHSRSEHMFDTEHGHRISVFSAGTVDRPFYSSAAGMASSASRGRCRWRV